MIKGRGKAEGGREGEGVRGRERLDMIVRNERERGGSAEGNGDARRDRRSAHCICRTEIRKEEAAMPLLTFSSLARSSCSS